MQAKEKRTLPRSTLIFFLVVAVLFVVAAYYSTTLKKDLKLFKEVNPLWLTASVIGQVFTYILAALVYHVLLKLFKAGRVLNLWELFQTTIVTLFLNQAIPSEGVSGNTYIFHLLTRRKVAGPRVLSLILIELLTFYAAMELIIVFVSLPGLGFDLLSPSMIVLLAAGFIIYLLFASTIALIGRKKTMGTLFKKLAGSRLARWLARERKASLPTKRSLSESADLRLLLKEHKGSLAKATLYQCGVFLADTLTIFALFYGLGAPLPFLPVFIGFILTRIVSLLPVSPGALILYESSMTYFYVTLGASVSAAVIVTLLYRVLSFWLPMPFGLVMYRRLQVKEPHSE